MSQSISELRREYDYPKLHRQDLEADPFKQFEKWLQEALKAQIPEPHAMTLATATKAGLPSARVVLLRGFDERGFVFFTNYQSQKGQELAKNPHAALVFYWGGLSRQIRIVGQVSRISAEESDLYFQSRPRDSQLGAWASQQSQRLPSRAALEAEFQRLEAHYQEEEIPRPPFWGGFRLVPHLLEFWQGRAGRLHDRFRYLPQPDQQWLIDRLSP